MIMINKSEAEIALELYRSVEQSKDKHKRLKSSTFWHLFDIRSRRPLAIARISQLMEAQGLKVSVKSGLALGVEGLDDWVDLNLKLASPEILPPAVPSLPVEAGRMKALSIRQPYAGLIMAGIKNIENRSWTTKFRGTLAICATQKPEGEDGWIEDKELCEELGLPWPEKLCAINGACIGIVQMTGLVWEDPDTGKFCTDHPTLTRVQAKDWYNGSEFGFILERPQVITPIPLSGKLGLFNLPDEVVQEIKKQSLSL